MATAPSRTITIAITIAKTGRSIKKRAILLGLGLAGRSSNGGFFAVGHRMNDDPGPGGEQAFHDDSIAGLESLLDQPGFPDPRPGFHRPRLHDVAGAERVYRLQALVLLDRTLRNQNDSGAMCGDV